MTQPLRRRCNPTAHPAAWIEADGSIWYDGYLEIDGRLINTETRFVMMWNGPSNEHDPGDEHTPILLRLPDGQAIALPDDDLLNPKNRNAATRR